jgi:hypothetical protein
MPLYYPDPVAQDNIAVKSRNVGGEEVPGHDVIALPGTVETDIAAINAHLAGVNTKLQSIIDAQAIPAAGPKFGYADGIGTAANVNFPTKTLVRGCVVVNLDSTHNLLIRVGGDPAATQPDTLTVLPRQASPFIPCTNPSVMNMRSSASTIAACYAGA